MIPRFSLVGFPGGCGHVVPNLEPLFSNLTPICCSQKMIVDQLRERAVVNSFMYQKIGLQLLRKWQTLIEYCDKPGESLAYLLADFSNMHTEANMQKASGALVISSVQKVEVLAEKFSQLYRQDNPSEARTALFFSIFERSKVSTAQREVLNQPISSNDTLVTIEALKMSKAPGLDSFTSEFHNTFKFILVPKLLKLFPEILEHSVVPSSW